jgi:NAD(P)-dependent dehydrogenase (short-subunit alcohol dehydrogenase family)
MMPKPPAYRGRLAGKIALVTGAGSQGQGDGVGTGKAIAVLFAGEGAKICLVDREAERAEATRAQILAEGGEAFVSIGDVTKDEDCARFVAETVARYGGTHILVNNVGIAGGTGRLDLLKDEEWDRVMAINLKSALLMSRHAIAAMTACGGGNIVNIASIAALRAYGGGFAYGPSKAAMIALTRELAVVYGADGIRANTICPGHIFTPLSEGLLGEDARAVRRKAGPLGIEGDAWDVAAAALFFASDEARFITATCLAVDGGVTETGSLAAHAMILR